MANTTVDIDSFMEDGFIRLPGAFSRETAEAGCQVLYDDIRRDHPDFDPDDPSTYPGPVYRHPGSGAPPFAQAAGSPALAAACDALVGAGRWIPRTGLGTFPIRFAHADDAGDDGRHIESSFDGGDGIWRVNVASRNRALLALFLFTDVTEQDAPTRVKVGSHLRVAPALVRYGEAGVAGPDALDDVDHDDLPVVTVTGQAGDIFLCHPFLVHAADSRPTGGPRVMAQPGMDHDCGVGLYREDGDYSPVEQATRNGITRAGLEVPPLPPQKRWRAELLAALGHQPDTAPVRDLLDDAVKPNWLEQRTLEHARWMDIDADRFERAADPLSPLISDWLGVPNGQTHLDEVDELVCWAHRRGNDTTAALRALLHVVPPGETEIVTLKSLATTTAERLGPLDGGLQVFDGLATNWEGSPDGLISAAELVCTDAVTV
jgi:hypothetical protein